MNAYLLDTNICIFFLRGQMDLDKVMKQKGWENCYLSEVTIFELRYGAENSDNPLKSHNAVTHFIESFSVIPINSCVLRYAKEKVRLRKLGKPVNDEFDLLIGVTAVENKLVLVSDNGKHFKNIEGLQIENWFER